jgi:hypothetical protein
MLGFSGMKFLVFHTFCIRVCVFMLFGTALWATTVERHTLDSMVSRSSLIVEGTVVGTRTHWSADGKLILTTTTLSVGESIKGRAPRTLDITTVGGQIGKTIFYVAGMPAFRPGESTIVFLEPSAGYLTVFGLGQGKFTILSGQVSNSVAELSTPGGKPFSVSQVPVQTFKSRIYSLLDGRR